MQIKQTNFPAGMTFIKNSSNDSGSPTAKFKTILDETISTPAGSTPALSKAPPQVDFNPLAAIPQERLLNRVDKFVDVLDNYQHQLKNAHYSLKQIEPVVREMELKSQAATQLYHSLPNDDGLKEVLQHALILSSVEIAKFNRGDYVDG